MDLTLVQIDAQVDEADIGQVVKGNKVTFTVDAYPDATFTGEVEKIRLAATTLDNVVTYTVVIDARNPDGRLLPGKTANVEIATGSRDEVLTVPNEALRFQPRGSAEALVSQAGSRTGAIAAPAKRGREHLKERLAGLKDPLGLTEEETVRLQEAVSAELAGLRKTVALAQDGADPREQVRSRIAKAVRATLSPEQYRKYEELQRQRPARNRRSSVWTLEKGALVQHSVRIGLADGNVTEILAGLPEGAKVITRIRQRSD